MAGSVLASVYYRSRVTVVSALYPGSRRSRAFAPALITAWSQLRPRGVLAPVPWAAGPPGRRHRSMPSTSDTRITGYEPLLVIAGPCSVHDTRAALEYAAQLREIRDRHHRDLLIVMRVYFEKPRTV